MAVVIFDLMGTAFTEVHIIQNVLHPMLKKRFPGLSYEAVKEPYNKYSVGQLNRLGFWLALRVTDYEDFEKKFLDSLKLDKEFLSTVKYLKSKKHSVMIFSNLPIEWARYLVKKNGLEKYLSAMFISGEIGVRKPEPAAYEPVAEKTVGKVVYFVDDRSENLATAARFGWKTVTIGIDISFKPDFVLKSMKDLKKIL
jgi:HAD superfamily hydrolase (TIGR01509 family)